jgi:hypothetical protein
MYFVEPAGQLHLDIAVIEESPNVKLSSETQNRALGKNGTNLILRIPTICRSS